MKKCGRGPLNAEPVGKNLLPSIQFEIILHLARRGPVNRCRVSDLVNSSPETLKLDRVQQQQLGACGRSRVALRP